MLIRNQGPHHMWLISLSGFCMVFTKAVFSGLLAPLDFCYILIIFAGSVEFHSSPPRGALGLSPRKETERRDGIYSVTLDLKFFPAQVWLLDKG